MKRASFILMAIEGLFSSTLRAEDGGKVEAGGLTFTYAAPWTLSPTPGMMRVATLLTKVDGVEKPLEAGLLYTIDAADDCMRADVRGCRTANKKITKQM